jgi:hypothetical protein
MNVKVGLRRRSDCSGLICDVGCSQKVIVLSPSFCLLMQLQSRRKEKLSYGKQSAIDTISTSDKSGLTSRLLDDSEEVTFHHLRDSSPSSWKKKVVDRPRRNWAMDSPSNKRDLKNSSVRARSNRRQLEFRRITPRLLACHFLSYKHTT